jgi:hypothetical protein
MMIEDGEVEVQPRREGIESEDKDHTSEACR